MTVAVGTLDSTQTVELRTRLNSESRARDSVVNSNYRARDNRHGSDSVAWNSTQTLELEC